MITLKEIANMCGVTASTVSNVINNKNNVGEATKERILKVIEETGYQPNFFAQGIRKNNTKLVGIITEDLNEFSTAPIVEKIMAYCDEMGYKTILTNMRLYDRWTDTWYNDEEKYLSALKPAIQQQMSIKVDGIIYVAGHCRHIKCFEDNMDIPGIVVYGYSSNKNYPSVVLNDEKGEYDMTKYVISKGHKKIGLITGEQHNIHNISRLEGFKRALIENDIAYDDSLVCEGNWNRASGYNGAKILCNKNVTAIICMNDNMAAGVYDYLYEKGDLLKNISVVGYDNKELSEYLRPLLTTYDLGLKEIGAIAAKMLIDKLEDKEKTWAEETVVMFDGKLIERDSVNALT